MATHQAIAAVGLAIKNIIENAPRPAGLSPFPVRVCTSEDLASAEDGISIHLFRVGRDELARNSPAGIRGERQRAHSLQLVLHYVVFAGSRDSRVEAEMLGWAMLTLEQTPILSGALLNSIVAGSFDSDEVVELVPVDLTLTDATSLWLAMGVKYRAGAFYLTRGLRINVAPPPA